MHAKPVPLPFFGGILHIIGNFDNEHWFSFSFLPRNPILTVRIICYERE